MINTLKKLSPVLFGLLLALSTVVCDARTGEMVITDQGKAAATIVIAQDVNPKAKIAAEELQTYLCKLSGAKLPIVTDIDRPQGSLILVGKSKLTDEMGVAIPSGMSTSMREEGFVIVCKGNILVLAGNDDGRDAGESEEYFNPAYHGTEYAVYDFLNRLGVRWFMPGEYGEIVPHKTTITFPEMQISEKPVFAMRGWWCYVPTELQDQERRWKIRNKLNPARMFAIPFDGSANLLLPKSLFKEHPEYFALKADGTREIEVPSFTHPKTQEIAAETIKEYFRKHPEANCYGFSPYDGVPRDCSPETQRLSGGFTCRGGRPNVEVDRSSTEEWLTFANKVTELVRKDFPDVFIATNGYANRVNPPQGMKLDDHLVVMYADLMSCTYHSYDNKGCWLRQRDGQMLKQWCKLSKNVWIYNYEPLLVSLRTPLPDMRKVTHDFRLMKKLGVMGFYDEAQNVWAEYSIQGRYLRAKLGWNPDGDDQALLRDFYAKWYGKAAEPMQAFYTDLEDAVEKARQHGHEDRVLVGMYTPVLLQKLAMHLAEAEKVADTDRDREHVRADRLIYEHLKGYVGMLDAEEAGDFAGVVKSGDYMLDVKKSLNAINPFYCWHNEEGYISGVGYWKIKDRKEFFQSVADRISGKTGRLITLLPQKAKFRTDLYEDGVYAEWYASNFDDSGWRSILATRPYYGQGYQDKAGRPDNSGYVWYRMNVDVPASAKGRKIMLYAPAIEMDGWVWVNGKYAGRRPFVDSWIRPIPMELDVTDLVEPGKVNTIAVRASTCYAPGQLAGGLVSRSFLYTPVE